MNKYNFGKLLLALLLLMLCFLSFSACDNNKNGTFGFPSAPQNFLATANNGQIILSWSAPLDNGGSVITKYEVTSGYAWIMASSNNKHTFTGLTGGVEYTFMVRAFNSAGSGIEATVKATPVTVPTAPRMDGGVSSHGSIMVFWRAPLNNGGSKIIKYEVSNDNGATWGDSDTLTMHTFTGLTNEIEYTLCVRAVNEIGAGESTIFKATPVSQAPIAVENFSARELYGEVILSWMAPSFSGGYGILGYEVSKDNGATWIASDTQRGHTFSNLTNGIEYIFKVRGINIFGAGEESVLIAIPLTTPHAPTVVQNFIAKAGYGIITLSWSAPLNNGGSEIIKYEVSKDNGETWTDSDSVTGHVFMNLDKNNRYTLKVRAINAIGNGEEDERTAVPDGLIEA